MSITHPALPPLTDADFDSVVAPGSGLVAVDFTADWCPPCRMMAPLLDAAMRDYPQVRFFQIDADAHQRAVTRHQVRGLPTLLLFRDGAVVDRITGAVPNATLRARLDALVG